MEEKVQTSVKTEVQTSVKPEMQTSVAPKLQPSMKQELIRITVKSDVQLSTKLAVHAPSDGKPIMSMIQASVQKEGTPVNSKLLPYI